MMFGTCKRCERLEGEVEWLKGIVESLTSAGVVERSEPVNVTPVPAVEKKFNVALAFVRNPDEEIVERGDE